MTPDSKDAKDNDAKDNDSGGQDNRQPALGVDVKLLEILVCPLTKGSLRYDREAQELISDQAGLAYPIRDGIPIMLVDEARSLDDGGEAP
jgi:uncharacterized protein YbaR (Trm112 family)